MLLDAFALPFGRWAPRLAGRKPHADWRAQVGPVLRWAPQLPAPELRRRELQQGLLRGWGLWSSTNFLKHALPPRPKTEKRD